MLLGVTVGNGPIGHFQGAFADMQLLVAEQRLTLLEGTQAQAVQFFQGIDPEARYFRQTLAEQGLPRHAEGLDEAAVADEGTPLQITHRQWEGNAVGQ
ncbi:hypothetical protein D3C76_1460460 [compost metagenome]